LVVECWFVAIYPNFTQAFQDSTDILMFELNRKFAAANLLLQYSVVGSLIVLGF